MELFWKLTEKGIARRVDSEFCDRIEMSGAKVSAIVTYGADGEGRLVLSRDLYFPALRMPGRDTHATLRSSHKNSERDRFFVDGKEVGEFAKEFVFDGILHCLSADEGGRIRIVRHLFPCVDQSAYVEYTVVENVSGAPLTVSAQRVGKTSYQRGAAGTYAVNMLREEACARLGPGEALRGTLCFWAGLHSDAPIKADGEKELEKREEFVKQICDENLILDCSDRELEKFFSLAKLRAAESIFDTAAGPLHSPGGGPFYAAVWANDQAEYACPFFPYLGYERANVSCLNAYGLFANFMGPDLEPIPSSIIDEGRFFWCGAGDRGDAAMYLYGCSRCLLALGDEKTARERFWTLRWAADFCLKKLTSDGVVASDSDELEGRLPSGGENLCTSSLTYGGLVSAAALARELDENADAQKWEAAAARLRGAIEKFFGAKVSGFDTYRYYAGNTVLRSWICIPLTMDIFERAEGTADALLSDRLFGDDGVLSVEGETTFWDRSTLYAFRGLFNVGECDRTYGYLRRYVQRRLLGAHVPYAVEAFPEGDQRHLSAESALFCRVVTEGMFGIVPVGLRSVRIRPSVPLALGRVRLRRVRACGGCFDLDVERLEDGYSVTFSRADGSSERFTLPLGGSRTLRVRT
ncbi:MAG: hypothetical protein IJV00_06220 [Clostridia bacterium]|nr:hypothetical protein [Clostridia bacterium]